MFSFSTISEAKFSTVFDVFPRCKEWSFAECENWKTLAGGCGVGKERCEAVKLRQNIFPPV
jgi:hypothetical protein